MPFFTTHTCIRRDPSPLPQAVGIWYDSQMSGDHFSRILSNNSSACLYPVQSIILKWWPHKHFCICLTQWHVASTWWKSHLQPLLHRWQINSINYFLKMYWVKFIAAFCYNIFSHHCLCEGGGLCDFCLSLVVAKNCNCLYYHCLVHVYTVYSNF